MPDRRPAPIDRARRTVARLRSRGPAEIAGVARGRVREWVRSDDELIMLVRAAAAPTPEVRHDPGLVFREAVPGDADLYARVIGTDSATTFRRRLTPTTSCFLVEGGDELLHASWVTTGAAWTREIDAYVVPPAADAYVYESFTRPEARGRGVYPFALAGICAWARDAGLGQVWVAVEDGNAPSLKAIRKAGFEVSYTMRYGRRRGRLTLVIEKPEGLVVPAVMSHIDG
ncbi:MAG TPA: GNAT family N-acetyltransferase [Actinomycetota bacterium]|nr:GNAT family N-acetyltransferase [Actinomycetota bacterium]